MAQVSTCLVGVLLLFGPVACKAQRVEAQPEPPPASRAPALEGSVALASLKAFGAPLVAAPVLALSDVLATPERYRDRAITVEGLVRSACTRRGCWMEVATGADPKLPGCRVTFKDYGFFVPTDSAGLAGKSARHVRREHASAGTRRTPGERRWAVSE